MRDILKAAKKAHNHERNWPDMAEEGDEGGSSGEDAAPLPSPSNHRAGVHVGAENDEGGGMRHTPPRAVSDELTPVTLAAALAEAPTPRAELPSALPEHGNATGSSGSPLSSSPGSGSQSTGAHLVDGTATSSDSVGHRVAAVSSHSPTTRDPPTLTPSSPRRAPSSPRLQRRPRQPADVGSGVVDRPYYHTVKHGPRPRWRSRIPAPQWRRPVLPMRTPAGRMSVGQPATATAPRTRHRVPRPTQHPRAQLGGGQASHGNRAGGEVSSSGASPPRVHRSSSPRPARKAERADAAASPSGTAVGLSPRPVSPRGVDVAVGTDSGLASTCAHPAEAATASQRCSPLPLQPAHSTDDQLRQPGPAHANEGSEESERSGPPVIPPRASRSATRPEDGTSMQLVPPPPPRIVSPPVACGSVSKDGDGGLGLAMDRARRGLARGVLSLYKVVALCADGTLRSVYDGSTRYQPGVSIRSPSNVWDGVTPGLFLHSNMVDALRARWVAGLWVLRVLA